MPARQPALQPGPLPPQPEPVHVCHFHNGAGGGGADAQGGWAVGTAGGGKAGGCLPASRTPAAFCCRRYGAQSHTPSCTRPCHRRLQTLAYNIADAVQVRPAGAVCARGSVGRGMQARQGVARYTTLLQSPTISPTPPPSTPLPPRWKSGEPGTGLAPAAGRQGCLLQLFRGARLHSLSHPPRRAAPRPLSPLGRCAHWAPRPQLRALPGAPVELPGRRLHLDGWAVRCRGTGGSGEVVGRTHSSSSSCRPACARSPASCHPAQAAWAAARPATLEAWP